MIKGIKILVLLLLTLPLTASSAEKNAEQVFLELRQKLDQVKDYVADVKLKVDISFMRVPPLHGTMYFKTPDKMKLDRKGGISIMPKKSISMTLNSIVPGGNVTVIDAGYDTVDSRRTRVIKVVPGEDQSDIVLTKIWVDETRLLALRTETTTRDNGTVKMELKHGRFTSFGLPDHVTFFVDVKDYKLPKGVTMDYDNAEPPKMNDKKRDAKPPKGRIEITYLNYEVNQGLSDEVFVEDAK